MERAEAGCGCRRSFLVAPGLAWERHGPLKPRRRADGPASEGPGRPFHATSAQVEAQVGDAHVGERKGTGEPHAAVQPEQPLQVAEVCARTDSVVSADGKFRLPRGPSSEKGSAELAVGVGVWERGARGVRLGTSVSASSSRDTCPLSAW